MVSLIVHALLGVAAIVAIVVLNPHIFKQPATPKLSVLEAVYYIAGIAATVIGYYCNIQYINQFGHGSHNPIWGEHGSWREFIQLGYANWAASSASSDYTIISVILLPLFMIVDGRRRGVRQPWLYFMFVLTASSSFALAFYLATVERLRRVTASNTPEPAALRTD
jgi:hypothetical protein